MIRRMLLVAAVLLSLAVPASSQAGPYAAFCPYTVLVNGPDFVEYEGCVVVNDSFVAVGGPVNTQFQGQYTSVVAGVVVLRSSNRACVVATAWALGGPHGSIVCVP